MIYRPEIDGLRTLAILPVLFFHAGFAWMPGGFLGVDVFFVISGYLITSIIMKERQADNFSLAFFYERRARRILPALFFVLAATLLTGGFLLSPQALVDLAHSVIATNVFAANLYFWQHIDYFTGDTALLPLLHLWSLGIEEQFYVLLPLVIMLLWHRPRRLLGLLVLLAVASLLLAAAAHPRASSAAFYLLPTRAWELLAGAFCAFYFARQPAAVAPVPAAKQRLEQYGSAVGLLLLLGSLGGFTVQVAHPGLATVVPVLATVLIILYAKAHTFVAQLLSLRPMVGLGLLSYSAYLWHQPLFAFTRLYKVQNSLGLKTTVVLLLLTFVLAALSWRFVEAPFRNRRFLSQKRIFTLSALGILTFIISSGLIISQQGFAQRFSALQQMLFSQQAQAKAQHSAPDPCFLNENQPVSALGAACRPQQMAAPLLIMGDSHAQHLAAGFTKDGQRPPLYSASGCAPIAGIALPQIRPFCEELVVQALADVATFQPKLIVLHANWLLSSELMALYDSDKRPLSTRLAATVQALRQAAPQSQIVVVGDVPQWQPSLIALLSQHPAAQKNNHANALPFFSPNPQLPALRALEQNLKAALPLADPQLRFISLLDFLCQSPTDHCRSLVELPNGSIAPMAWDYGHLTVEGAQYVGDYLKSLVFN